MRGSDRYAGDAAWTEWFDLCSVARCSQKHSSALTDQIRSAMFSQLSRSGYDAENMRGDDPVSFFDSYFLVKGCRDDSKPLKSYFRYRIESEGCSLHAFVCGTLFSSRFGRIHDIVREWIASVRGWKPHSLQGADGRRHVVWESAAEKDDVREIALVSRPSVCVRLDRAVLMRYVDEMLNFVSLKIKVEKGAVAFLLYATAQGLAVSSPEVLAALGVRKSRANKIKETIMKEAEKYFRGTEVEPSDIGFARVLLAVCEEKAKEVRHG